MTLPHKVRQLAFACIASLALHAIALAALGWGFPRFRSDLPKTLEVVLVASESVRRAAPIVPDAVPLEAETATPAADASSAGVPTAARTSSAVAANAASVRDTPERSAEPRAAAMSPSAAATSRAFTDVSASASNAASPSTVTAETEIAGAAAVTAASEAVTSTQPAPASQFEAGNAVPRSMVEWRVQEWLARYRTYPRAARRAGYEGTVWVRFVLDRKGEMLDAELIGSSGHALLDRAALDLLARAEPYPALPVDVDLDRIELVLPVDYRLARNDRG